MPFIGKQPTAGFASIVKDDLTADGSTTQFTLSKQVANANDIAVFVGNVRQEPTDAYTVNGTTLTMTAAPASAINFYVLHIAGTIESSVVPADGTITSAKIQASAVTDAKIAGMASSKLTGALSLTTMPVGSIIQVKSATVTGNLGSGVQDLVSVSITPTDNTNKILVMGNTSAYTPAGATSWVDVYRDSTFIYRSAVGVGYGSNARSDAASPIHLDDPQTTSAITYKLRGNSTGSSPGSWNYYTSNNTTSTSITVMEVVV